MITHNQVKQAQTYSQALDRSLQSAVAKITLGISPAALMLAFFDWYLHVAIHPTKQLELIEIYQNNLWHLLCQFNSCVLGSSIDEHCVPIPQRDKRFVNPAWQQFPYNFIYQSFLMSQNWWQAAATNVRGVNKHHEQVVDFTIRQILDMLSPSNSLFTNPEIQQASIEKQGQN